MTNRSKAPVRTVESSEPKLRTPEAARRVGLAAATLSKLRCVGGGPRFIRLGRAIVYDVHDLDAWVDSHGTRGSTADEPDVRP